MPYVCESRFRVRYAETDQMGMVYYANYLIWMEVGRSDYCRQCGFSYRDLEREEKAYLAVAEANCRYRAPARYDDEILVETDKETPEQSARRIIARLEELQYITASSEPDGYSDEDAEEVRRRLEALGYV